MSFGIGTLAQQVQVNGGTLRNDGPDALYYRDRLPVDVTTKDGALASGASVQLSGEQYIVSAGRSSVQLAAAAASSAGGGGAVTPYKPEDYGAKRDGISDDTAAITNCIAAAVAACQANGTYYCEVQFTAGIYNCTAATTKGGATLGNAQIPLSAVDPTTSGKVTLVLRGGVDGSPFPHWNQTVVQKSGVVIRTTLTGQTPDGTWGSPSVIGGPTANQPGGDYFSNMRVIATGLVLLAPLNPSVLGFDFRRCAQADVPNLACLAEGTPTQLSTRPTNGNGLGLYMPAINNNDSCNIGTYTCDGFYYGIGFSDHLTAQRLGIINADTAMFVSASSGTPVHGGTILYASVESCNTVLELLSSAGGTFPLHMPNVNAEIISTTAFKDTNNSLRGYIGWAENASAKPTVTGCAHIRIVDLNANRGSVTAPAVPATTVALINPFWRDAAVTVIGGTVTVISVDGVASGLTSGTVVVPSGKTITLTYSVAPTWKWTLL